MTLSWAAPKGGAVADYVVFSRTGGSGGFGTAGVAADTSFTASGLLPGTEYEFHVVSRDSADATSGPSATVRATTAAPPTPLVPPVRPGPPLEVVRAYALPMGNIGPCLSDRHGVLWVANDQQARLFMIHEEQALDVWPIPPNRWKCYLPEIWQNTLVYSDWNGSVYQMGRHHRAGRLLYEARDDDLPVHRLAARADGALVAATWGGRVRVWTPNAAGVAVSGNDPFVVVPYLPLHLAPLAGGGLAVADQADYLRWYDATGREIWSWKAPGPVQAAWAHESAGQTSMVAQIGHDRLVKVKLLPGDLKLETAKLSGPIRLLARRRGPDEHAVIIREVVQRDGTVHSQLDWLSTAGFGVLQGNQVRVPFGIRDITPVSDPQQRDTLIAVGVTTDGRVFSVCGREYEVFARPAEVQRLVLDYTGRFVYVLAGNRLFVSRTPGIKPLPCRVGLEGVTGKLVVNETRIVRVTLRNDGPIAVYKVKAELKADRIIDPASFDRPLAKPAYPAAVAGAKGDTFEIDFTVFAHQAGEFNLTVRLTLEDRGGLSNPVQEIVFPIRSERA